MGRQRILPPRRQREHEALLLRSAESLGRMIGSLQRQIESASRLAEGNGKAPPRTNGTGRTRGDTNAAARHTSRNGKGPGEPGAKNARSSGDTTSARGAKSTVVAKAARAKRSGAKRTARKATRHT